MIFFFSLDIHLIFIRYSEIIQGFFSLIIKHIKTLECMYMFVFEIWRQVVWLQTSIHFFYLSSIWVMREEKKSSQRERERSNNFVSLLFIYNDSDNSKSQLFFSWGRNWCLNQNTIFIITCSLRINWVLLVFLIWHRWIFFDIIYLISFSTCFLCQYHNLDRLYD
jgi:hypothetical protein